jgi:hypothetical protein
MSAGSRGGVGGTGAWVASNPYAACNDATTNMGTLTAGSPSYLYAPPSNCTPQGIPFESRSDSYWDGVTDIHGVRAYESDLAAWTSPDALPGTVTDPLSELTYSYARNNPGTFDDSTGFASHCRTVTVYTDQGPLSWTHCSSDPYEYILGPFDISFGKAPGGGAGYQLNPCKTIKLPAGTVLIPVPNMSTKLGTTDPKNVPSPLAAVATSMSPTSLPSLGQASNIAGLFGGGLVGLAGLMARPNPEVAAYFLSMGTELEIAGFVGKVADNILCRK